MARAVWDPSAGSPMPPEQLMPIPSTVGPDGRVLGQRSVASEGPCPTEVGGGAGGAPDGRSLPIYRVSWD